MRTKTVSVLFAIRRTPGPKTISGIVDVCVCVLVYLYVYVYVYVHTHM